MMFGTREEFKYFECSECGCLSLQDVPEDLSGYYPADYYSLNAKASTWPRKLRNRLYLSPVSFLVNWHSRSDFDAIRRAGLTKSKALLDVGCGAGQLVADLRELGYRAEGVDPFIGNDICDDAGIRVHCTTLDRIDGQWDAILFRHSLEHMPSQVDVLRAARLRLRVGGVCIVCIPVVGCAWKHYGTNWMQLDAPRHLVIHTVKSFSLIAARAGFTIDDVVFDSDELQFWASELYRRDQVPTASDRPGILRLTWMRRRARELNRLHVGDKAQFYLRPDAGEQCTSRTIS